MCRREERAEVDWRRIMVRCGCGDSLSSSFCTDEKSRALRALAEKLQRWVQRLLETLYTSVLHSSNLSVFLYRSEFYCLTSSTFPQMHR